MTSPFAAIPIALALFGAQREIPPRTIPFERPLVSVEWLGRHLADPDLVVLHVAARPEDWRRGHIAGARWLNHRSLVTNASGLAAELPPLDDLVRLFRSAGVADGRRVVLYGEPLHAARAWLTLDLLGLGDHAAILDGGLEAWRIAGGAISRGNRTDDDVVAATGLTVRPTLARLVDADWVRDRLDDDDVALLDTRPDDEYTGADGGHGAHRAGHIPGAVHLHWSDLLRPDGRLAPELQLRARLAAAGAEGERTVVVYCMVGLRASLVYFVARMLDLDVRFYDGSWEDWSNRNYPVRVGREPAAAARQSSCL